MTSYTTLTTWFPQVQDKEPILIHTSKNFNQDNGLAVSNIFTSSVLPGEACREWTQRNFIQDQLAEILLVTQKVFILFLIQVLIKLLLLLPSITSTPCPFTFYLSTSFLSTSGSCSLHLFIPQFVHYFLALPFDLGSMERLKVWEGRRRGCWI